MGGIPTIPCETIETLAGRSNVNRGFGKGNKTSGRSSRCLDPLPIRNSGRLKLSLTETDILSILHYPTCTVHMGSCDIGTAGGAAPCVTVGPRPRSILQSLRTLSVASVSTAKVPQGMTPVSRCIKHRRVLALTNDVNMTRRIGCAFCNWRVKQGTK